MQRFWLVWMITFGFSYGQIVVVTSAHSPLKALSQIEVSRLFLAQTNRLPHGAKVELFELDDTKLKETFYSALTHKTPAQLRAYWTTLIFTGRGKPPKVIDPKSTLPTLFANHPNGLLFLPKALLDPTMKVLFTLP